MSGSFAGFSEEDIRNLSHKNSDKTQKIPAGRKIVQEPKTKHRVQKQALMNPQIFNEKIKKSIVESIPEGARLCPSLNDSTEIIEPEQNNTNDSNTNKQETEETIDANVPCKELTSNETIPDAAVPERKLDLAQFQERQKLIEEQNKKRKELLAKALAVRTQQTKEEARKLEAIRQEFKKLDILLSGDVNILRQQIEVASLEFMEAEKRYYKIEKEFLNAKILLHQKSERKELLTEHLCAVIEKNEERKAEKLNELINKLNLKSDLQSPDVNLDADKNSN